MSLITTALHKMWEGIKHVRDPFIDRSKGSTTGSSSGVSSFQATTPAPGPVLVASGEVMLSMIGPVTLDPRRELTAADESLKVATGIAEGLAAKANAPLTTPAAPGEQTAQDVALYQLQTGAFRAVADAARAVGMNTDTGKELLAIANEINALSTPGVTPEKTAAIVAAVKKAEELLAAKVQAAPTQALEAGDESKSRTQLSGIKSFLDPVSHKLVAATQTTDPAQHLAAAKDLVEALNQIVAKTGTDDPTGNVLAAEARFIQAGIEKNSSMAGIDALLSLHRISAYLNGRATAIGGTIQVQPHPVSPK